MSPIHLKGGITTAGREGCAACSQKSSKAAENAGVTFQKVDPGWGVRLSDFSAAQATYEQHGCACSPKATYGSARTTDSSNQGSIFVPSSSQKG